MDPSDDHEHQPSDAPHLLRGVLDHILALNRAETSRAPGPDGVAGDATASGGAGALRSEAPAPDPLESTEAPRPPLRPPPRSGELAMPRVGATVRDTWELSALLGRGGFGVVFRARHEALGRDDAIKFLHPHLAGDEELRARFRREAMLMAKLRGDHLVHVHDYGEHEGLPFFAMERLEGESLHQRLGARRPLPLAEVHLLARGILRGLAEIHEHDIVHRDVKPANIFIVEGTGRVKMLDFGLAMTSMRLTSQGAIMGTPLYMAPELLLSPDATASVTTDLYSAGVVLYQMLTGRVPFSPGEDGHLADFLRRVIGRAPRSPRLERPEIPEALEELVLAAIDKDPARRPPSAAAFVAELDRACESADDPSPAPKLERASSASARAPSEASPEPARSARTRSPLRSLILSGMVLTVAASFVGLGLFWPGGALPVSSEAGEIIVSAPAWASEQTTHRYEVLCDALRRQAPRRARCARVSRWSAEPSRYRERFLASGAAMAIHVSDEDSAAVMLDDALAELPLLDGLPPVDLREPEAIEQLAPLLALLPRASAEGAFEVPPIDVERVGYEWATIGALLRRLHRSDTTRESVRELRALARCEGAREGVAEDQRWCDIARYLAASVELSHPETCPRIEPVFRRLSEDTDPVLSAMARLLRAECIVSRDPRRAAAMALDALGPVATPGSCELVNVLPFAPHLVTGTEPERRLLARLETFDPRGCPGAAEVVARRGGGYRGREQWARAARDFYQAYGLDPGNRVYLIAWAEARLRTPLDHESRERLRYELRRDLFGDPIAEHERGLGVAVVYLRWLVTRAPGDAVDLLALYDGVPQGVVPLPAGACDGLRALACHDDDDDGDCAVDLLRAPKSAEYRPRLEAALQLTAE